MKKIAVIFRKEFIDILRDRRSLIMMFILPILFIYLGMNLTISLRQSQTKKAEEKILNVGLITRGNAGDFQAEIFKRQDMKISENVNIDKVNDLILNKEMDFVIEFEEHFDQKVMNAESGEIKIYYKSSEAMNIAKRRINGMLKEFREKLLSLRLQELDLKPSFIKPITITNMDLSTQKEKLGEVIGGFLPYIFVIFCFMGAMYPAIDLAAGEKERATLETLLSSPVSRMQIVLGKFFVITCTGIISALLSILALYMSIKNVKEIPKSVMDTLIKIIEPQSIGLLFALVIPLCAFFSAVLLSLSLFAKSYKEAQSIIMPFYFFMIVPVLIGFFPGIELNVMTASIPVLNVSLATKAIISGTIKTGLLVQVYLSLIFLAGLGLLFCSWWFKRESVIFRGI